MFTVFLNRLEFYGYHGVSAEERIVGHRFLVSVRLTVDGTADTSDQVEDTADYGQIAELVLNVSSEPQCSTVERLARLMAERLLEKFPAAIEAEVALSKLSPPIPAVAEEAGVTLKLVRE